MKLGLFLHMPLDEYLAVDAVSSTGLKLMARSAWHYRNRVDSEPTVAMRGGSLAHCAILEPGQFDIRYVVRPEGIDFRTKDGKAWRDAQTCEVIAQDQYDLAAAQRTAVFAVPELANMLRDGSAEVSIFWVDTATGLYCKARPDWLPSGVYADMPLDLKTTADESPNGFGRAAARLRYDLQDAHYTAGIEAVLGCKVRAFVFGAVTSKPPVLAVPYTLTDEIRDQARDERRDLLDRLAYCTRENQWPAYGAGIQMLDFPAYAKAGGEVEVEWSGEETNA